MRPRIAIGFLLIAVATAVFWRTAYPTITWWDSSNYSLAAVTLGITNAPGSLLLTLLGWLVTRLPLGLSPAHTLNLLAGLLGALATVLVYVVALRMFAVTAVIQAIPENRGERAAGPSNTAAAIGGALGALAFGFAATLWEHSTRFTPYVLTAVFTGLILLVMLRWWEHAEHGDAWRWLALLGLLFGLDFSVHRTNALLLPAVLVWILIRHPRTLVRPRAWLAGGAGLVAGLAVHLLIIPIAATTQSPLNMFDPSNWSRFWDYVSLAQFGGGFMVNLWPRNAHFWNVQVHDFVRVLGANFFQGSVVGWLPGIAAIAGLASLWRRNRRLAVALALVLVLHVLLTVLYFNIPENFFRSLDRHYLPVFVTVGALMAYGLGVLMERAARAPKARTALVTVAASVGLLVPAVQLAGNWTTQDASARWFTRDYAANALEGLPPDAIYFTVGDNDSFPVWYLQAVEGVRRDVLIINLSMANASWYLDRLQRRHPGFPFSLTHDQRTAWRGSRWQDSTLVIPVIGTAAELGLPPETAIPDSLTVQPRPTYGGIMVPADAVLIDLVRTNAFRRPLAFAFTAGQGSLTWLAPYARVDGIYWRIVPTQPPPIETEPLRANLLERYAYRGYADRAVGLDDVSQRIGALYFQALDALLDAEEARGAWERCREARARLETLVPPDRVGLPDVQRAALERRCEG